MPWPKGRPRPKGDEVTRPTAIASDLYQQACDRAKADSVTVRSVLEQALREYLNCDRPNP